MKNDKEFTGKLLGFDDYVSKYLSMLHKKDVFLCTYARITLDMVLEDVTE